MTQAAAAPGARCPSTGTACHLWARRPGPRSTMATGASGAEPGDRPPRLPLQLGWAPTPPPPCREESPGPFQFRSARPRRGGPRLVTPRSEGPIQGARDRPRAQSKTAMPWPTLQATQDLPTTSGCPPVAPRPGLVPSRLPRSQPGGCDWCFRLLLLFSFAFMFAYAW